MKNAASTEKLTSTGTDIANRVKNLFSGSPVSRRRRAASADVAYVATTSPPSANPILGIPLNELLAKDGLTIPFIVKKIVHYIEEQGLDQVGVYRINGNVKSIEKLRAAFDRVGDADFGDEDLPTVAGLLKLFLRELPDSVIPEILVPHFVSVQQSYSGSSGTPEALDALRLCLHYLPEPNYNVLKYLIKHLATVAESTDKNKMTPVSLSIVFGPNLMHCGDGLEGLKMQGYSNSIVCQLIRFYKELFGRARKRPGSDVPTKPQPKRSESGVPSKPLPYAEHVASKKEQTLLASGGSLDMDVTHSERSIDEAIQDKSNDTLSPISPRQLSLDELKSPSGSTAIVPSAHFSGHPEQLMEDEVFPHDGVFPGKDSEDVGEGFQRRNAKRGLSFKPRDEVLPNAIRSARGLPQLSSKSDDTVRALRPPQLTAISIGEDDLLTRTYSHSSPGTSPPTSPVLTPRASSIVNSVIGASIRDFLFRPPQTSDTTSQGLRQNIYGLLLPDPMSVPSSASREHTSSESISPEHKAVPGSGGRTNGHVTKPIDADAPLNGVVKRRMKNLKGQRNRKSALHGEELILNTSAPLDNSLGGMKVQILSVSPEHKNFLGGEEGVTVIESRSGKVLDLVKQFDEEDQSWRLGSLSPLGGEEVMESSEDKVQSSSVHREDNSGRRKLDKKSLDTFEKSGVIMGMGGPVRPKVSFTTTTTDSMPSQAGVKVQSESIASDEEVFGSPHRHPVVPPEAPSSRGHLSTTTSDDVFLPNTSFGVSGGLGDVKEFDEIPQTTTLQHLTLSRPKGPPSRRKPRHHSNPDRAASPDSSATKESTKKRYSHDILETWSSELKEGKMEEGGSSMQTSPSVQPKKAPMDRSSTAHRVASHPTPDTSHPSISITSHPTTNTTAHSSVPLNDSSYRPLTSSDSTLHPFVSTDSTPSSSPSIRSKSSGKENKALAQLDLMSLAPENKQVVSAVKRGWSEGGVVTPEGGEVRMEKPAESAINVKEIARKMHELKNSVRDFEAKFIDQHKRKPSNHEKSPIRSKLIELAKLKKLFKEMKESASEQRLSQTAPAEVKGSSSGSNSRLLRISEASTSEHVSPRSSKRGSMAAKGGVAETNQATPTASPLEKILNKIMTSLETHRKAHSRPAELGLMKAAQIQEEKHAIQKLLLNFEKHHGRPQSHADKEVMRPLYDRYRAVKRVCSGSTRDRENSTMSMCLVTPRASTAGHSLGSTTDTLPTLTLMASLTESVEVADLSKSAGCRLSSEKQIVDDMRHTEQHFTDGHVTTDGKADERGLLHDGHVMATDGKAGLLRDGHVMATDGKADERGILHDGHGTTTGLVIATESHGNVDERDLLHDGHGTTTHGHDLLGDGGKSKRKTSSSGGNTNVEEFHTASL